MSYLQSQPLHKQKYESWPQKELSQFISHRPSLYLASYIHTWFSTTTTTRSCLHGISDIRFLFTMSLVLNFFQLVDLSPSTCLFFPITNQFFQSSNLFRCYVSAWIVNNRSNSRRVPELQDIHQKKLQSKHTVVSIHIS